LRKLAIALLAALLCWAYPAVALSKGITAEEPIKTVTGPVVIPVMSKEDAVPTPTNSVAHKPVETKSKPTVSVRVKETGGAYSGRHYSKEEVQQLIRDYSAAYGINPDVPLCIARLESGYNQFSKNRSSTASGVFQYLSSTWRGTDEGRAGLSVFDADANVRAAIKYMASRRSTQPWEVRHSCPSL
jgi:hypothetical protein